MISERGKKLLKDSTPIVEAHFKCAEDPYHPKENVDGYINLGTAENFLMDQEARELIKVHSQSEFNFHYDQPSGSLELKENYQEFLKHFLNIKNAKSAQIVFASGASAILEMLSYSILNPGDEVLVMGPLYNGFYHDLEFRFEGCLQISHCFENNSFSLNIFLKSIKNASTKTKAILINNPHNPTGNTLTKYEIREIIKAAKHKNLLIIADEIYANSCYGELPFISFLDDQFNDLNYRENILHVYGLAKDFCMSGLKVGAFYSCNNEVNKAMSGLSYFHTVSTQTQALATNLLGARKQLEDFFKLNNNKLRAINELTVKWLKRNQVSFYPASAGIFLWVDLREKLGIKSIEDENEQFELLINKAKINISPGTPFGAREPGFFRICFAKDGQRVELAQERIESIFN